MIQNQLMIAKIRVHNLDLFLLELTDAFLPAR